MSWRSANIAAAIAIAIWFAIFAMGRDLAFHVYDQGPGIFPSSGQIDGYVIIPVLVAFAISLGAWAANGLQRGKAALGALAIISIVAILPYMFGYSGGV